MYSCIACLGCTDCSRRRACLPALCCWRGIVWCMRVSCIDFDVHSGFELWSALSQSSWIRRYIRITYYYCYYVCVCMCVFIFLCTCVCICICMHVCACMHVCLCMCLCVCACVCVCACICWRMHVYLFVHACVFVCACICWFVHPDITIMADWVLKDNYLFCWFASMHACMWHQSGVGTVDRVPSLCLQGDGEGG